jgi:hypothetical protein
LREFFNLEIIMTVQNEAAKNCVYVTARMSFPWILDPQLKVNDKGENQASYNVDLIFPPNDEGFVKFMQTVQVVALEKWKENTQAALTRISADRKTRCYGSGEEKTSQKTFQVHPGYAGNVYVTARSPRQPQIIDASGKAIDPTNTMQLRAAGSKLVGGNWCHAVIRPWCQQNAQGIGMRCDILAIQLAREDELFGAGAADVTGMFGAVAGAAPAFAPAPAAMPPAPFSFAPVAAPVAPAAPLGIPNFLQG